MADLYWRGDALPVTEIKTLVVGGTAANGQIYTVTINGKVISYTADGSDTNSTIATAVQALLSDTENTPPEFDEAAYTVDTATITARCTSAGIPFDIVTAADGTGTFITTTTTAATGPNFFDLGANWSTGSPPANSDNLYVRQSSVDILYGLDMNAVTVTLLDIDSTYTGKIGLPDTNPLGYQEYRETYLKIGATNCFVGRGFASGPGRFRWNAGSVQTALNIYGTGTPDDGIVAAIDFVGTHASNAVNVQRGTLAVGLKPGTASTVATMNVGSKDNPTSDATIYCGYNVTLGTISATGGIIDVWNGATTVTLAGGTLNANKGAFTTINNDNGTVNYDTAGTCGTYVGGTNSILDCSRIVAARTFTSATFNANSTFRDPAKTVTFGGSGAFIRCKMDELREWDVGENFYFLRG